MFTDNETLAKILDKLSSISNVFTEYFRAELELKKLNAKKYYEYKIERLELLDFHTDDSQIVENMNNSGSEGWKLIHIQEDNYHRLDGPFTPSIEKNIFEYVKKEIDLVDAFDELEELGRQGYDVVNIRTRNNHLSEIILKRPAALEQVPKKYWDTNRPDIQLLERNHDKSGVIFMLYRRAIVGGEKIEKLLNDEAFTYLERQNLKSILLHHSMYRPESEVKK